MPLNSNYLRISITEHNATYFWVNLHQIAPLFSFYTMVHILVSACVSWLYLHSTYRSVSNLILFQHYFMHFPIKTRWFPWRDWHIYGMLLHSVKVGESSVNLLDGTSWPLSLILLRLYWTILETVVWKAQMHHPFVPLLHIIQEYLILNWILEI